MLRVQFRERELVAVRADVALHVRDSVVLVGPAGGAGADGIENANGVGRVWLWAWRERRKCQHDFQIGNRVRKSGHVHLPLETRLVLRRYILNIAEQNINRASIDMGKKNPATDATVNRRHCRGVEHWEP